MIIFEGLTADKKGINISSLYEEEITVLVMIIDGYTGLCSYATKITLHPGINYFATHFVGVFHRRFEVWSVDFTKLYLKFDIRDDASPNLEQMDIFHRLKNFDYPNLNDYDAALPLYEIFCGKLYDKEFCSINPGDVVVDIGGHLGFFSYYAITKGVKQVYCFEPAEESFKMIKKNFDFPNLIVEQSAVTLINGEVDFFYNKESSMQSGLYSKDLENAVVCNSVNLNDYLIKNNIPKIDYLKIDCEGAEYEIIESLSFHYLLENIDKMCIEFHFNTGGKLDVMLDKLKHCDFQIHIDEQTSKSELGVFYATKVK